MSKILDQFNKEQEKKFDQPKAGDTVRVHQKIKEGDKERIQIFEGIVLAKKHGKGISATITVRKVVDGIGVERIFPIHSPSLEKIEIISRGKTKRSKLYYLKTAKGKKAKLKHKEYSVAIAEEPVEEKPTQELISESEEAPTNLPENK